MGLRGPQSGIVDAVVALIVWSLLILNLIHNPIVTLFYLFRIMKEYKYLLCTMFVQSIGYRQVPKLFIYLLISPIAGFLQ